MTIIWCGGEDIDFPHGSLLSVSEVSSGLGSRCAIRSQGTSYTNKFDPITSVWLHFRTGVSNHAASALIVGLVDRDSTKGIHVRISSTADRLHICKFDGSTATQLAIETGYTFNTSGVYDLNIVDFGESSTINLYFNSSLLISFSGDSSISGISALNAIAIGTLDSAGSLSEFILSDTDTRTLSIVPIYPNAAGDVNEFDYGAYTDIDEITVNDADQIYTDSADNTFLSNVTGMPAGDWTVKAVRVAARCVDGTGSLGIKVGIKSGGTVDVDAAAQNCAGYWQTKERIMQINPVTSVAFTPSEINSLQLAVKSGAV